MGLRSGLSNLGSPRRGVADLAAPIQLAPAAQQSTIKSAHQPPRTNRGQPVEAPQLEDREERGGSSPTSRLAMVVPAPRDRCFQRRKSGATKLTGPIGLRAPMKGPPIGSGRTLSPKRSRMFCHGGKTIVDMVWPKGLAGFTCAPTGMTL